MHSECLWLFLKVLHHIAMLLLYWVFFDGFLLLSHLSLSSKSAFMVANKRHGMKKAKVKHKCV